MPEQYRVLCVDDDASLVDLTATYLEREGPFTVETATTAANGLGRLREGGTPLDAVVSDYQMPGLDGIEFLEAVRADRPDLPFVLFTGKGSEAVASEAISAGVTDYLQKETGTEQYELLANRLENAIERARMKSALDRERQRRDRILAAAPVGIVGHAADGAVVFSNDRAAELVAASEAELAGEAYADAGWRLLTTDGEPVPERDLPYRRVVEGGERRLEATYLLERSDGTVRRIAVYGAPLGDDAAEGAVIAFHVVGDGEEGAAGE